MQQAGRDLLPRLCGAALAVERRGRAITPYSRQHRPERENPAFFGSALLVPPLCNAARRHTTGPRRTPPMRKTGFHGLRDARFIGCHIACGVRSDRRRVVLYRHGCASSAASHRYGVRRRNIYYWQGCRSISCGRARRTDGAAPRRRRRAKGGARQGLGQNCRGQPPGNKRPGVRGAREARPLHALAPK